MKMPTGALVVPAFVTLLVGGLLPSVWAEDDFIVYSDNNILTIFKLQTEDMPFLAGGSKFLITPNPFSHTAITNHPSYNIDFGSHALVVADNDPLLDSDPTDGIIELVGVQPGVYSVIEIVGPVGFITNETPGFAEIEDGKIATAFSNIQIFSITIDFTSAQKVVVPAPPIDDSTLSKLQAFGAKVGGTSLIADNLPSAIITITPSDAKPAVIIFTDPVSGQQDASTLFDILGIPTYSAPSETSFVGGGLYVPPPFIASDSTGGKVVFTPKIDNVFGGLNLYLNLDGLDVGLTNSSLESLNIPIGVEGQDVGFKIKVQDTIPAGMPPSPQGGVALFLSIDTVGNIDFGNSASFASSPTVAFKVNKDFNTGVPALSDGCPDVRMYLRNPATNTWEILAQPSRNPPGDTADMCSYTQTLPHFSDYVVAGNDGSVPTDDGHHDHGGIGNDGSVPTDDGHHDHGGIGVGPGHGGHSGSHSGHGTTTPTLQPGEIATAWKRVQINNVFFTDLQGGIILNGKIGQQMQVNAQFTNTMHEHQPYAFIVQVLDENGFSISVSWVEGHLDHGQTVTHSRSWTPEQPGSYKISVMVWDSIGSAPAPLADKADAELQVRS